MGDCEVVTKLAPEAAPPLRHAAAGHLHLGSLSSAQFLWHFFAKLHLARLREEKS